MNQSKRSQKILSLYFLCNGAFLALMLTAGFLIYSGQGSYRSHAAVDKQYVATVISSGETEAAWDALKQTEVARATGFQSVVSMMDLMLVATIIMAAFFIMNGIVLFRLRPKQTTASVPVMVRS